MTSLRSMMESDAAAGGVFFPQDDDGNPSGFNVKVFFYPRTTRGRRKTVRAVVDYDRLEGTRESLGDGPVLNRREGSQVRESIVLVVPATLGIAERQVSDKPDLFKVQGEMYAVKRVLSRDDNLMDLLCVRVQVNNKRLMPRTG